MHEHPFQPREIGIELVRGCNFSCAMCPVTSNEDQEPEKFQFLDLARLTELVAELDRWPSIERIWFFHFGEPMAHPKYRECLEILHRSATAAHAEVIQHTNGSLLRGAKADAILDIPVIKKLVFSFDGYGDKQSFEVMRGPHFDRVLANIRAFTEQARRRRPDLQLATCSILPKPGELPMVDDPPSREEAEAQLHALFDPLGVRVEVRALHDYSGNDALEIAGKGPARIFGGCPFVEKDSLYFTVNGWAQPCCAVYDEKFNVGRLDPETGFGELLNGSEMSRIRHALRLDHREEVSHCANCKFSLGGCLPEPALRRWWEDRDDAGLVVDPAERAYVFGQVVPTEHKVVRLELGCGYTKTPGFIGLDRYPLPGVDIVGDLDVALPFANDSVDLVYASHSLEHVADLHKTMAEVYRVCKHGAQVCIVAPYHFQKLNFANPYHTQVFNEHTARFWTAEPDSLLDPAEYAHPNSPQWGLHLSDNREVSMDIRCVRMEFFYYPDYEQLPPEAQRRARATGIDVCDQIVYHLLVVKRALTAQEFRDMAERLTYFEPGYVQVRKLRLETERLRTAVAVYEDRIRHLTEENALACQAKAAELASLEQRRATELASLEQRRANELADAQAFARFHADTAQRLVEKYNATRARIAELETILGQAQAERHGVSEELRRVTSGTSWRVAMLLFRLRHVVCPPGTLRERLGRKAMAWQRWVRGSVRGGRRQAA